MEDRITFVHPLIGFLKHNPSKPPYPEGEKMCIEKYQVLT